MKKEYLKGTALWKRHAKLYREMVEECLRLMKKRGYGSEI